MYTYKFIKKNLKYIPIFIFQFDAEILYWETKNREQMHQIDFISQEVNRMETTGRLIEEQVYILYIYY